MPLFGKPKYTIQRTKKREIPEGLWTKCEECSEALYNKTLEENLIQPTAALKSLWTSRKAWNQFLVRKAGYLDKKSFDKLRFGSYILLSSNDLGVLSNYGFNRRDFLAVMSFLDSFSKKPLDRPGAAASLI